MRTEKMASIQRQPRKARGIPRTPRTRHPAMRGDGKTDRRLSARSLRARVASAFRAMANGVEPRQAQQKTNAFYRSSGHAWAKNLR